MHATDTACAAATAEVKASPSVFGDLDPRIDGRQDPVEPGAEFTGYPRLQRGLWKNRDISRSGATLRAELRELVRGGVRGGQVVDALAGSVDDAVQAMSRRRRIEVPTRPATIP